MSVNNSTQIRDSNRNGSPGGGRIYPGEEFLLDATRIVIPDRPHLDDSLSTVWCSVLLDYASRYYLGGTVSVVTPTPDVGRVALQDVLEETWRVGLPNCRSPRVLRVDPGRFAGAALEECCRSRGIRLARIAYRPPDRAGTIERFFQELHRNAPWIERMRRRETEQRRSMRHEAESLLARLKRIEWSIDEFAAEVYNRRRGPGQSTSPLTRWRSKSASEGERVGGEARQLAG